MLFNASLLDNKLNIGAEYHFNQKVGLVLDFSSGISTLCLAIYL
jgi:hypothetical protein